MPSESLPAMRSRGEQLPPLSEVLPELRHNIPPSDRISQFPRTLYQSPSGPPSYPESHTALAPSPLHSSSRRGSAFSSNHSQYHGESSPSSAGFPDGSLGHVSPGSTSASSRGTTVLPPMSLSDANRESNPEFRDQRSLPPLYSNGVSSDPEAQRRLAQYESSRGASPRHAGYPTARAPPQEYVSNYSARSSYASGNLSFEPMGDYGDSSKKKRRGNLPKQVTDVLRLWFSEHVAHPYPTEDEKQALMNQTGLSLSQISNWFINARRRSLPQMTSQAQAEAKARDSSGSSMHP